MNSFLLVNGQQPDQWYHVLEEALRPFGWLESAGEETAVDRVIEKAFDVIVVDATGVRKFKLLVERLAAQRPQTRIVVVTASPQWESARAAFLAGAVDYVFKSSDRDELRETFREILSKPYPSLSG